MKKTILFSILLLAILHTNGQDTLAGWNFSGTNPDAVVDVYSDLNSDVLLKTENPQRTVNFLKTGIDNGNDKCAETTGWHNGNGTKYWQIEFVSLGFKNLKLSSVQRSCEMHFGPKNFKVQYRIDCCDTLWHDIQGSEIKDTSNWQMGVINNLDLPEECDNKELPVKIRWIMTSNLDINNNIVTMMGMSRIDNIFITGEKITGKTKGISSAKAIVYPNPSTNILNLEFNNKSIVQIFDLSGKLIKDYGYLSTNSIDITNLYNGIYIIKFIQNKKINTQRFVKM
ncbi:MAG: T9SS type A sorting domain-containing protein [Bacteroidetes bacterium]|nr:T9SS type A sorting domain-containing protein [Bacteroidota bacterium]